MSQEVPNSIPEYLAGHTDLQFAMEANGFKRENGEWVFDKSILNEMSTRAQRISFFGPSANARRYALQHIPHYPAFFSVDDASPEFFEAILSQGSVTDTVAKYRRLNPYQAERITYLLGGIIRHMTAKDKPSLEIEAKVKFASQIMKLGEQSSGDAIASAISTYILSDGSTEVDRTFSSWVYHMSEAIKEDPITPLETKDLGLSQIARLRGLIDRVTDQNSRDFPKIDSELEAFNSFPTVGAEFHLPPDSVSSDHLLERLATLNMSQYQPGSYIQFSRNDRDVMEVRMNPSVYPVTIANWRYIKQIIPELESAFFHVTFNRSEQGNDFKWGTQEDKLLLQRLKALGLLSYAALYKSIPHYDSEEINFGEIYLGQTMRVNNGEYSFSGNWNGKEGDSGQFNLYTGFGDNLPYLAYYPSMVLAEPKLLDSPTFKSLHRIKNLRHALSVPHDYIRGVFSEMDYLIYQDRRLRQASESGAEIIEALKPQTFTE